MATPSVVFPEDLGSDQTGHAVGFTAYKSSAMAQTAGNIAGGLGADAINSGINSIADWTNLDFLRTFAQVGVPQGSVAQSYTKPLGNVFLYLAAGGQAPMTWDERHIYTDVKLARAVTNYLGVTEGDTGSTGDKLLGMAGKAINPRIEVLFQTTKLREFDFTFLMAPQSENESNAMKDLIKIFRKNSAPTLGGAGYLFDSPSEWGIAFWYRKDGSWIENTNIPKIRRSVCTAVSVSYPIPGGEWSTFSNGHPVSAMIQLHFLEMSIVDSKKIEAGY